MSVENIKTIIALEPNDVYVLWNISKIDRLASSNSEKKSVILKTYISFSSLFKEDEVASVLLNY